MTFARWCGTRARVVALERDLAAAVVASTDLLDLRGDVELTLAEVLRADGQLEAAAAARNQAIRLYLQKGNISAAAYVRAVVPARSHEMTPDHSA